MLRYFATLPFSRLVLWCYLAWYLAIVGLYLREGSPTLWLSSLGMSAIVGTALVLSTSSRGHRPQTWTVFRLFLMPFCVSSYSALIKGHGFVLIFPSSLFENLIGAGACLAVITGHFSCRLLLGRTQKTAEATGASAVGENREPA